MSIPGTHCRAVPPCPLSLSLLSLHGGSENCQSSDWLVPDKGPLNGRVCVCVGVWTLVGPRNHDTRGPGAPRGRGILGGAPGDVAFCRNSVTTCCVMTQRCSATFAARSHSLWLDYRRQFARQWPRLWTVCSRHKLHDCGSVRNPSTSLRVTHTHTHTCLLYTSPSPRD